MNRPDGRISVFDLDGTLIRGNSSFKFCYYLVKKKIMPPITLVFATWNYFCHLYGNCSLELLHKKTFSRLLKGLNLSILEEQVDLFIQEVLPHALYMPALERLRSAQKNGHFTLILSNGPSFLVRKIAQYFCVSDWRSTEYSVDENNCLSTISFIMEGRHKADAMLKLAQRHQVKIEHITAYSDSHLDLPLLQSVGKAVAVNPTKKLKKFCKLYNWETI